MPSRDVIFRIIGEDAASPAFKKAAASAEGAAATMTRASDRMVSAGHTLTTRLSLPLLAIGGASVKVATDFNSAMTRIQTQAGGSAKDVATLSKQVLAMKSAQQGPVDLANALYHLKSVGMTNVEAMKALRQASDLAAVGHSNLEDTTNALAGAWRTGIVGAKSFHQAVETLNAVVGAGNMKMPDVVGALGTGILPTAKTFGLTLKDVGSALALFTDEGVPADAAATRLRMTFSLLGAPSKAAAAQLKSIGITQNELGRDMRKPNGLITAVGDLKKHLTDPKYNLSLTQQAALLSRAFGGGRSSSAILSMLNNYDVLRKKQEQVTRGMAKYDADVKAQAATPQAQFDRSIATLERAGVVLGDQLLPQVTRASQGITHLISDFTDLSPATRRWVVDAGEIAIAVGPVLAITGRLARSFITLGTGATKAAKWMATPYRQTASQAAAAAARTEYANAQLQADTDATSAAVARAAAMEAQASEDAAVRIAEAAEQAGAANSGLARSAMWNAISYNAAMQSEAEATEEAALKSSLAATEMQSKLTLAMQNAEGGAYKMQSAMAGLGVGLTVGSFTRGASQTTKELGVLGSALGGAAIGATMGPWGAAIGGVAGALGDLATAYLGTGHGASQASREAQAAMRAEQQAVDSLYQSLLSVNGAYDAQYKSTVTQKLIGDHVLQLAQQAHISPATVVQAALGNTKAVRKVQTQIGTDIYGTGHLQVGYSATGQPYIIAAGKYRDAADKLRDALGKEGVELGKAQSKYELYVAGQGKSIVSSKLLAKGVAGLRTELKGEGTALTTSTNDQIASSGYAVKNTAIVRANMQAIAEHSRKMVENGKSINKASDYWQTNTAALEKNLLKLGFARSDVEKLFAQYSKPPKPVALNVNAQQAQTTVDGLKAELKQIKQGKVPSIQANSAAGRATIAGLQKAINSLRQARKPSLYANIGQLKAAVNEAQAYLNSLHNKTLTVTVNRPVTGNGRVTHAYATGGVIRGPGSGTSDSIIARVSNGEAIIPAAQTARHRPLIEALIAGRTPAYADGGIVGAASTSTRHAGRGRTVRLHIDLGEQLGTFVRDVVLDELSYEAGRLQ